MSTQKFQWPGPESIATRLDRAEAEARQAQAARRLEASTIRGGATKVLDADGVERVRMGKLPDGEYGFGVVNDGVMVNLLALLNSQIFASSVTNQEGTSSATFTDLATAGPKVTVNVKATGRLLVICTSQIQWIETGVSSPAQRGGWCTVEMSGANIVTTGEAADVVLPTLNIGVTGTGVDGVGGQATITGVGVFEDLVPGDTEVTMKYASQYAGETVDFGRRTLIVVTL